MSDDHSGAILEAINEQLKAILEGQAAMADVPEEIREINDKLAALQSNSAAIRAAVTDQSHQLDDHEVRITTLEQAA